ncbi:MAG: GMC oxidoreductase, partial [Bacteroidota bacterium]
QDLRDDKDLLQKSFSAVNDMLKTNTIPASYPVPAKVKAMQMAAEKTGAKNNWRLAPLYVNFDIDGPNHVGVEQKPCVGCGDCCTGCNYSAKNTMIMNYLPDAKNHGAEMFTCINVRYVEKQEGKWRVHFNLLQTGEEKFDAPADFISADIVVLAAGSLGSTELLLRSKQNGLGCSYMLGQRFTGNGDFLGIGYNNDERANSIGTGSKLPDINDPVGPNMTSLIDLRNNDGPGGMVILEGVVPGIMAGAFKAMVTVAATAGGRDTDSGIEDWLKEKARVAESLVRGPYYGAINNTMLFLVISNDDDSGKMFLKDDRLRIEWPKAGEQPIFEIANKRLYELTKALGGTYTESPAWSDLFSKQLVTVHPLGGCIMGENSKLGVVNHKGQVFTGADDNSVYDGLYVGDGAIIPRSLSINPSLTISALAERNCYYMAKDRGWSYNYDFPPAPLSADTILKPGIEFTEKMTGYVSVPSGNDDFEKCFEKGKDAKQECEFILSMISYDVEQFINDPKHEAGVVGTFTAPLLSSEPMTVTAGTCNIFENNAAVKNTRMMKYSLPLSAQDGKQYFLYGYTTVHDDPGFDSWKDITTLLVTIYEGKDTSGKDP